MPEQRTATQQTRTSKTTLPTDDELNLREKEKDKAARPLGAKVLIFVAAAAGFGLGMAVNALTVVVPGGAIANVVIGLVGAALGVLVGWGLSAILFVPSEGKGAGMEFQARETKG